MTTYEEWLGMVKQPHAAMAAMAFMPEEFKTAEVCLEAVKQSGTNLIFVPEALKTAELCTEAVKQDGGALEYVPETLKTAELCIEAIKQIGGALEYMPENIKTIYKKFVPEYFQKEYVNLIDALHDASRSFNDLHFKFNGYAVECMFEDDDAFAQCLKNSDLKILINNVKLRLEHLGQVIQKCESLPDISTGIVLDLKSAKSVLGYIPDVKRDTDTYLELFNEKACCKELTEEIKILYADYMSKAKIVSILLKILDSSLPGWHNLV